MSVTKFQTVSQDQTAANIDLSVERTSEFAPQTDLLKLKGLDKII